MKLAKLLHNPGAGDENHTREELIQQIKSKGFNTIYHSSKERYFLRIIEDEVDFIIVAGGDGTIRKVVKKLMERRLLDKNYPIALLPIGTANNISKTLGITASHHEIIKSWINWEIKKIDIGKIYNFAAANFFIEGLGFGVFPRLIKEMINVEEVLVDTPEKNLKYALRKLQKITSTYEAKYCHIVIDGDSHSGKYLLVEVLNMTSIGPNLVLAPDADPGDGFLEVVLIAESQKNDLDEYIKHKLNGTEGKLSFPTIKAKSVVMRWAGHMLHVDDQLIMLKEDTIIKIELLPGVLQFLVPNK
ncbi:diacylglycerol/lipid kinase family protein [Arcticibacter eurypsychrophilus]|uniref:diacylglycerol/lipid kinase family protein n=1 Tax=Arcticibacter eurypsychrophilus TaxID=1434752 RepID=UPI00084D5280|nr:diacylglycerol kinase family protein [Arcticibacter eurypsychrophilus]